MLPHEASFFDMFIKQAENVHAGAKALVEMLTHYTGVPEQAQNIKAIEHTGDEITHALITKLNQTFVTPFDREDIHVLSTKVDDVLDLVDAAAARMVIYRVSSVRPGTSDLARVLYEAPGGGAAAVRLLDTRDDIRHHSIENKRPAQE